MTLHPTPDGDGRRSWIRRQDNTMPHDHVPPGPDHRCRLCVRDPVLTTIASEPHDHLARAIWHEGRGVSRRDRC